MYNNKDNYCNNGKHSAQQRRNKNSEQQHNDVNNCMASSSKSIRCVLVGDACVGKTSLIVAYTKNGFSDRYVPTAFDNYSVTVNVDEKPLKLELCDTAGRAEFDSIRPLSYVDANVFLLCFSTVRPSSFDAVTERWLPELRAVSSTTPIILVGTQSDLRFGKFVYANGINSQPPVDPKLISKIASEFQIEYIESSAITQHNLKEVFDLAILYGLNKKTPPIAKVPRNPSSSSRNNVNKSAKNGKTISNKTTSPSVSATATIRGLLNNAMNGNTNSISNNSNNSHIGNNHNNNDIGYRNNNANTNSKFHNVTNGYKNNRNNNNNNSNGFPVANQTNLSKRNKIDSGNTHENAYNNSGKSANNYFTNDIKQNKDNFYSRQTPLSPISASNITNYGCGYDSNIRNERPTPTKPTVPSTTIKAGFKKLVSMTRRFL